MTTSDYVIYDDLSGNYGEIYYYQYDDDDDYQYDEYCGYYSSYSYGNNKYNYDTN